MPGVDYAQQRASSAKAGHDGYAPLLPWSGRPAWQVGYAGYSPPSAAALFCWGVSDSLVVRSSGSGVVLEQFVFGEVARIQVFVTDSCRNHDPSCCRCSALKEPGNSTPSSVVQSA